MGGNQCHCEQPADWLLIATPSDPALIWRHHWACCDIHVAEAARQLIARAAADTRFTTGFHIVIRPEAREEVQ